MTTIPKLNSKLPVIVVGGAVCDRLFSVPYFPQINSGVEAQEKDELVGGSAFHVAKILSHLDIEIVNAIPLGNGPNGKLIKKAMKEEGIDFNLLHSEKDNGWYMAIVNPKGEHTSVSLPGCESIWTSEMLSTIPVPEPALVYASGHELVSKDAKDLRDWIFELPPKITRFIDLGPRITGIDKTFLRRLLFTPCILSLNESDVKDLCGSGDFIKKASDFSKKNNVDIVCRCGKDGTWIFYKDGTQKHAPAYPVSIIDTIGAGDYHCGGVLAGLSAGIPLSDAVDLGNKVAAYGISNQGSQNAPTLKELNYYFKK
jgi:sugar/nucleoside kinase (ribokinase family)